MKYPTESVIKALRKHSQTIAKLTRKDRDHNHQRYYEVHSIVHNAIDLLARLRGPTAVKEWMSHRKYRQKLMKAQEAAWSEEGRKACRDLFEFTITSLEADIAFRPQVDVKDLPMPEVRTISEEHKAALAAGRERAREAADNRVRRRRDWETSADRQNRT